MMGFFTVDQEKRTLKKTRKEVKKLVKSDVHIELFLTSKKEFYCLQAGLPPRLKPRIKVLQGGGFELEEVSHDPVMVLESERPEHPHLLGSVAQLILDRKSLMQSLLLNQEIERLQTQEADLTFKIRNLEEDISEIEQTIQDLILTQGRGGISHDIIRK